MSDTNVETAELVNQDLDLENIDVSKLKADDARALLAKLMAKNEDQERQIRLLGHPQASLVSYPSTAEAISVRCKRGDEESAAQAVIYLGLTHPTTGFSIACTRVFRNRKGEFFARGVNPGRNRGMSLTFAVIEDIHHHVDGDAAADIPQTRFEAALVQKWMEMAALNPEATEITFEINPEDLANEDHTEVEIDAENEWFVRRELPNRRNFQRGGGRQDRPRVDADEVLYGEQ